MRKIQSKKCFKLHHCHGISWSKNFTVSPHTLGFALRSGFTMWKGERWWALLCSGFVTCEDICAFVIYFLFFNHKLSERPLFLCGEVGVFLFLSDHIHAKNNRRFSFFLTKWLLVISSFNMYRYILGMHETINSVWSVSSGIFHKDDKDNCWYRCGERGHLCTVGRNVIEIELCDPESHFHV